MDPRLEIEELSIKFSQRQGRKVSAAFLDGWMRFFCPLCLIFEQILLVNGLVVHPIGVELGKPAAMVSAVRISLVLCGAIYFTIGIFGYLLFGDSVMDDILVNFDQGSSGSTISSLLNDIVRLSYALHLMLVFPLLNFSLRANIDELLFPKRAVLATDNKRFVILTLVLLGFSYVAAIAIPSIWYFFQFMGSTSVVCLAFIFPGIIALRDIHGISTRRDRIIAAAMVILAVVTSTIAISTNICTLVGNKS
ncbi:unnamed protein product [Coffea canephora]|uniref:Amino acid transporter transmembrane domain-containing protein n=2 Tax=Coffea TaxID=13442 RepID=A0A068UR13_COFCA|nr:unnamed protein product [Coffea canephora]